MEYKIIILVLSFSIFEIALETDPRFTRNMLKFVYGISYKYKTQLSHSIDSFYVVAKLKIYINDIAS